LLGLSRAAMVEVKGAARRNAFMVIIVGVLLVMVPLWLTGTRITEDVRTEGTTRIIATRWVAGSGYEVQRVDANEGNVSTLILGHGTPPAFQDLGSGVRTALQRPVIMMLEVVPAEKIVSQTPEH